jgi:hypothetical protein
MLRQIDKDIWVAERPLTYFGLSVGTRMTLIKLSNGELVVISPIDIDDIVAAEIDRIGRVVHIIAPNLYHYLFAASFKDRYPHATFWGAPGLTNKRPNLTVDRSIAPDGNLLLDELTYTFFDGFQTLTPSGFDPLNECVFFHPPSRTLILTDTAFNFDNSYPLLTRLATRLIGGYRELSPSLLEKIASRDKAQVRGAVDRVLAWDFDRVIVAHGCIVETGGKEQFRSGYARF